jgi:predicted transcriptional regulator
MRLASNLIKSIKSTTKNKGPIPMASEILKLTTEIVISHASTTELTSKELVQEIMEVYRVLASLEGEVVAPASMAPVARTPKARPVKMVESPEAKAIEAKDGLAFNERDYLEFMASREG